MRRTSYPTSGYSLGQRGARGSRRLLAPRKRKKSLFKPALVAAAFLVLGIRAITLAPAHEELRVVASTGARLAPSAAARPVASQRTSPTLPPTATARPLPPIRVLAFSTSWIKKHPIAEVPRINGRAAIVVDVSSGQVLYWQAAASRYPEASLTKMMTAMVADDIAPLDQVITVTRAATQIEPNHMGISAGEKLTLQELLDGMLLDSGNDAAEAVAQGVVDRDRFIDLMNQKAAGMRLINTRFANPSGLDDPNHFSSAYDLAVMAATIITQYPDIARIVSTRQVSIPATATHKAFSPYNLDRLLSSYPGAIGVKPGYTGDAGYCLAAAATRGGRTIVAVVLGTNQHFTDATTLLDFGFRHPVTP